MRCELCGADGARAPRWSTDPNVRRYVVGWRHDECIAAKAREARRWHLAKIAREQEAAGQLTMFEGV